MGNGSIVLINRRAPIVANAYSASLILMKGRAALPGRMARPGGRVGGTKPRIPVVFRTRLWYKGNGQEAHFRELVAGAQGHESDRTPGHLTSYVALEV